MKIFSIDFKEFTSSKLRVNINNSEGVVATVPPVMLNTICVGETRLSLNRVKLVTLTDSGSIVSEKVIVSIPIFMSTSKESRTGEVISGSKPDDCNPTDLGSIDCPFVSVTACPVYVRKVVLVAVARSLLPFIELRSTELIVISIMAVFS